MDHESNIDRNPAPVADGKEDLRRRAPRTGTPSIAALQAEIEETREETIHTINELERRLSYDRLKAQVKDKARHATVGRMRHMAKNTGETSKQWGRNIIETVRDNPLPALVVGGGMAWLIASRVSRDREEEGEHPQYVDRRQVDSVDKSGTYGIGFIDRRRVRGETEDPWSSSTSTHRGAEMKEAARRKADAARQKAHEARERAAETGDRMKSKAAHFGEQVKSKAQQMGSDAAEYADRARRRVAHGGRSTGRGFLDFVENNPLAAAGIVLTAGAVVGATIPSTRYEDETLGHRRDEFVDRARETGREQVEKVGSVVREATEAATEAAKDEAEAQGLVDRETSEEAEEKAREMARSGSEKVKEKAKTGYQSMKETIDQKRG
ncbi:MAG TPA: DUF3618 domain-containing protein [Desulfosarcina sp.]|nr:DUF3618 domain-containing protein [Desulfosarcina sp.]